MGWAHCSDHSETRGQGEFSRLYAPKLWLKIGEIQSFVQSIVHAACRHYNLDTDQSQQFVLLGALDGDELELTDESLKLLSSTAVVTLSRLEPGNNATSLVPRVGPGALPPQGMS